MPTLRSALRTATLPMTGAALVVASPALADNHTVGQAPEVQTPVVMSDSEIQTLPPEYRSAPTGGELLGETEETTIGADGVETVVRTRYITPRRQGATASRAYPSTAYYPAPQPVVFERDQWLEECRRRTEGADDKEKGGIIGGLLGAIAGGIIGNRVADGERLAGTLIGAGTGGLAGLAIGSLIGGKDDDSRYDCEAALNTYIDQYGEPGTRLASRTLPPAPAYPAYSYPAYTAAPAYGGYYGHAGCGCYPPQQSVMVPVRYEQRQRVIVRENVREELVPVRTRDIPPPPPRMIKEQPTKVVPVPRQSSPAPVKMIKN